MRCSSSSLRERRTGPRRFDPLYFTFILCVYFCPSQEARQFVSGDLQRVHSESIW